MKIVHSFWSGPLQAAGGLPRFRQYFPEPRYYWYSWVLSAGQAHKVYGDVELVTDDFGKDLLVNQLRLPYTSVLVALNDIPAHPGLWAYGKLIAYGLQTRPFFHIDGDVFLWKRLPVAFEHAAVGAQSAEPLSFPVYGGPLEVVRDMAGRFGMLLPPSWERNLPHDTAYNAGILGGCNLEAIGTYVRQARDFVERPENAAAWKHLNTTGKHDWMNCLTEQYTLAAVTRDLGIDVTLLFPPERMNERRDEWAREVGYTHLMGGKLALPDGLDQRLEQRIARQYPFQYAWINEHVVRHGRRESLGAATVPSRPAEPEPAIVDSDLITLARRTGAVATPEQWHRLPAWLRHRTRLSASKLREVTVPAESTAVVDEDPPCSGCQGRRRAALRRRLNHGYRGSRVPSLLLPRGTFDLAGFFDLVVVINLRRRPDRMAGFSTAIADADWPFRYPVRFEAVDGSVHRPPSWWRAGNGAWGCRCSQLAVIEQAIEDGVESLLILEDDAVFVPDFARRVEAFLRAVPEDWDSLYLGGQHLKKPKSVSDGVVQASNINRCHAWAARGQYLKVVRDQWADLDAWQRTPRRHIDHQLGVLHESGRYRVYAPTEWLVGQNAGQSNICGKHLAQRFWGKAASTQPRRPSILAYRAFTRSGQSIGPLANVKTWAEAEGKTFSLFDAPETWAKAGETVRRIRDAELVFIWNGAEPGCDWVKRVCQAHGTPFLIAENGLLPQKGYWHLDPQGIIGDSSLCGSLDWVTPEMLAAADRHIERHFAARRWKYTGDGGYILVPLQLESDTSIYLHSDHKTMQSLVDAVRRTYPDTPIIVRPHPVNPHVKITGHNVTVRTDRSTLDLAQHGAHVVGLTSTVLYETAALGAPTTALGRCPMAIHTSVDARRRLLAACVARQVFEKSTDLRPPLDSLRVRVRCSTRQHRRTL